MADPTQSTEIEQVATKNEVEDEKKKKKTKEGPPPPGSNWGDQSVEFWRDAVAFFNYRLAKHDSRIFNARFLFKTTTFVGSCSGVRELLCDKADSFEMGYKEYLSDIYGDVILFAENSEAEDYRRIFGSIFHADSIAVMRQRILGIIDSYFERFQASRKPEDPLCLYKFFKRLCSEMMISIFLDLDPVEDKELVEEITTLSVTHWHGIISVPVSFKGFGLSSGFSKALEAKNMLREKVRKLWDGAGEVGSPVGSCKGSFLREFKKMPFPGDTSSLDHLILLITALVPKAMASLLTSIMLSSELWKEELVGKNGSVSPESWKYLMLEATRMWPPFMGGRRIAKQEVIIDGLSIPAGRPVVYLAHAAHRDPSVFKDPDTFDWKRWATGEKNENDRDKIWSFGAGTRSCVGRHFMEVTITDILHIFMKDFEWEFTNPDLQKSDFKWLPVSRPKQDPLVLLKPRLNAE